MTAFLAHSVNQTLLSGPVTMPYDTRLQGPQVARSSPISVSAPPAVPRPIANGNPDGSVNHIAPSGPGAIEPVKVREGVGNSLMRPAGSMRPTRLAPNAPSVNHMLPSGPRLMSHG